MARYRLTRKSIEAQPARQLQVQATVVVIGIFRKNWNDPGRVPSNLRLVCSPVQGCWHVHQKSKTRIDFCGYILSFFHAYIGDHLHSLFPAISSTTHVALATVIMLVPTILLRTPTLLSYFSMIGTFATIAVFLIIIRAAVIEGDIADEVAEKQGLPEPDRVNFRPQGLILSLGIISYCFSGHVIVPSIYSSLRKPQEFERI
jgi:hypothetical protein